jgi:response regulator NasT
MTVQQIEKAGRRGAASVVVGSSDLLGMLGLQSELEQMGIRVAGCAADAVQAVRAARLLAPDAVILELGANRTQTLAAAREIVERRFAPVILMAAVQDAATVREGLAVGAAGFLSCPLASSAVTTIELAASRWAAMRALEERIARMERQLATREVAGSAKFLLMDRYGWREAEAYRYMQRLSMNSRKPMSMVASLILADGGPGAALKVERLESLECVAA